MLECRFQLTPSPLSGLASPLSPYFRPSALLYVPGESKLESLSPSSRWVLYKNTGSGEVEREARQPRARQRHLRREIPPAPQIMMSGLGLRLMASLRVENGPSPFAT